MKIKVSLKIERQGKVIPNDFWAIIESPQLKVLEHFNEAIAESLLMGAAWDSGFIQDHPGVTARQVLEVIER